MFLIQQFKGFLKDSSGLGDSQELADLGNINIEVLSGFSVKLAQSVIDLYDMVDQSVFFFKVGVHEVKYAIGLVGTLFEHGFKQVSCTFHTGSLISLIKRITFGQTGQGRESRCLGGWAS